MECIKTRRLSYRRGSTSAAPYELVFNWTRYRLVKSHDHTSSDAETVHVTPRDGQTDSQLQAIPITALSGANARYTENQKKRNRKPEETETRAGNQNKRNDNHLM